MRLLKKADRLAARYFPAGCEIKNFPEADLVVGILAEPRPLAIGYFGTAARPAFHYSFKSVERRDAFVAEKVKEFAESAAYRATRKAIRKAQMAQPCPLAVGDVLANSWGYDQTNVDYFQVLEVKGRTVKICAIEREYQETGFMSGKSRPVPGRFVKGAEILTKKVNESGSVKIYSFGGYARKVDPAAEHYESSYA